KKGNQIDLRTFNTEVTDDHEQRSTPSSVQREPDMIGLLKYWFKECYNNHPYCRPSSPSFSPTRLLLIENEYSARIVETKDCNAHYPYVALSHCWGTVSRLKLQKSNMVDLLKHISITELPTTYREGISVTLALGFSYIWIDSLCVIQDDEKDWAEEAAMMKDVFEHCSINLSATAAPDSSQSNFTHRDATRGELSSAPHRPRSIPDVVALPTTLGLRDASFGRMESRGL
ncbi:HET-domain-containing protein, partial [Neurospora tetrasperma FGSC 2509]